MGVLAETKSLNAYCRDLKKKMIGEGFQWCEKISLLKLPAPDGKLRSIQCFAQVDILRLIEEIPSPKAEPLKREIARLANERMEEIANPDLAIQRGMDRYRAMGMTEEHAKLRARSVIHRRELTDKWATHGISAPRDFARLTDRESKGVFGKTTSEMKKDRRLPATGNLRDKMTEPELAAQDVADVAISLLIEKHNPQGYEENGLEVDKGSAVGARLLADLQRTLES